MHRIAIKLASREMEMVMYYYRLRDEAARTAMERFNIDVGDRPVSVCSKESPKHEPASEPAEILGDTTGNLLEHLGSETEKPRFQRGNGV